MKPFVIGVAGGSGSGKTTVVRQIVKSLGDDQVSLLEHDRYYRDRGRPAARGAGRAQLRPSRFARDRPAGRSTSSALRDRPRGRRAGLRLRAPRAEASRPPRSAAPRDHRRRHPDLCRRRRCGALMDVKVFVDADDDTRFIRRLQRDISERGRTVAVGHRAVPRHGQADAP